MGQPLVHVAVGMACIAVPLALLAPTFPHPMLASFVGGMFAIVPDFHWLSPTSASELKAFHDSPGADLFFFHHSLDLVEPLKPLNYVHELYAVGLLVVVFLVADLLRNRGSAGSLTTWWAERTTDQDAD